MMEFEQRKAELKDYIGNYKIEYAEEPENNNTINENETNVRNNNNTSNEEITKDNYNILSEENNGNDNFINTSSKRKDLKKEELKMNYFEKELTNILLIIKKYKDTIHELIQEKDDTKIINKLKCIYYSIIFRDDSNNNIIEEFINCLRESPHTKNEILLKNVFLKRCNLIDEKCTDNNYSMFEITNIDSNFSNSIDNPFINNSKYYRYPYILEKNIIKNNKEIYSSFLNLIRIIFKSKIIRDIYYLNPEFSEFAFPLEDNEIVNEIMNYTILLPFSSSKTYGYTQKEFPLIIVAVNILKYQNNINVSQILNIYSQIINTYIHEQAKHYLKSLVFYNSFRAKVQKRINSDLANDLGNLVSRTISMLIKYTNGDLSIEKLKLTDLENEGIKLVDDVKVGYQKLMDAYKFSESLSKVWEIICWANRYIERVMPWKLYKENKLERLSTVLYVLCEVIRCVNIFILPFMPETSDKISKFLNITDENLKKFENLKVYAGENLNSYVIKEKGEVLFPRITEDNEN